MSSQLLAQEEDELSIELAATSTLQHDEIEDEFEFLEEQTVESAARHTQEIGMSPSAITLITQDDIVASGATTIPDLLRLVPGLNVITISPAFSNVTARLPWTESLSPFKVLVDGRDINIELFGITGWGTEPISLDDVERIEIIRGPASALYGANALMGVISVTTKSVPKKDSYSAKLMGGESGMLHLTARATTQMGAFGFSVNGAVDSQGLFLYPNQRAKEAKKFRFLGDIRFSETQTMTMDLGLVQSNLLMPTSSGTIDSVFNSVNLRLAYDSTNVRGHLYWTLANTGGTVNAPLQYNGIRLAVIPSVLADSHVVDGECQWTLPPLYDPLMLIVGAGVRLVWLGSDSLLDSRSYADVQSPRYHQAGLDYWELLNGAFVHSEYKPMEWLVITAGLRFDYNLETTGDFNFGETAKKRPFLSPRFAMVVKPVERHFVRLGAARAFRRPSFVDTNMHPKVEFPADSPLRGAQEELFQEFMARSISNPDLNNMEVTAFELGYLGHFLDERISVSLDLYFNLYKDWKTSQNIVLTDQGFPDLSKSSLGLINSGIASKAGGELSLNIRLSRLISLVVSWSYINHLNPKNLITLGAKVHTSWGLLGSLYLFSRSEFTDTGIENPTGMMAPRLVQHMDNAILALGKLAWQGNWSNSLQLETGINLFLPVSFSPFHFRYHEKGGGISAYGKMYGGVELARMITTYLQVSY